ncbi:hypothetical protein EJ08DRAFT_131627 [Tothia fuscella]|uniref:F-box domain-containing protein n=1 Tax=Tothia fuscella TaxID=1048955 RepID=A0A9P4U0F3_9PEZI|nr:hypothetical protein EJ08DRAFT_131627 [Tothia fuscella]
METSANLGTLPVEISYLICEYLYESSFKCLFSMSLTCQSLNIATQPLMFRNVTLRISNSQELGRILDMAASRIKDIVQRYTRSIEIRRKAMIVEEGMHDLDTQNFGETPDLSDYDAYNDYVVGDEEALCAMSIWKPLPCVMVPFHTRILRLYRWDCYTDGQWTFGSWCGM